MPTWAIILGIISLITVISAMAFYACKNDRDKQADSNEAIDFCGWVDVPTVEAPPADFVPDHQRSDS